MASSYITVDRRVRYVIFFIVLCFLSGCAAGTHYVRLDSTLQKDVRSFDGTQYIPLVKICDAYGLDCRWDSFIRTATVKRGSKSIVLRTGSDTILVNGAKKKLDKPVILSAGAVFVPVSFVHSNLGAIAETAPVREIPRHETPKKFSIRTIVLDPGHGGKDPGAIGRRKRIKEKDLTLVLAKKLKERLEREGMEVILTRNNDTFISLSRRAEIANSKKADLFVSVHINSSRSRSLHGFECYYLSDATDDSARALEAFENSSIKVGEGASLEHSAGLDKTLWDMTLTENRKESSELAGRICNAIESNVVMGNRGVRSARFYVLKHTHMPSVLIEAGYLSNRYDESKLKDYGYLDRVADAVAKGILKYKMEYERTEGFTNI